MKAPSAGTGTAVATASFSRPPGPPTTTWATAYGAISTALPGAGRACWGAPPPPDAGGRSMKKLEHKNAATAHIKAITKNMLAPPQPPSSRAATASEKTDSALSLCAKNSTYPDAPCPLGTYPTTET